MMKQATILDKEGRLLNLLDLSDVTHVDDNYHPTSTGSDHSRAVLSVNNIGRRAKRGGGRDILTTFGF